MDEKPDKSGLVNCKTYTMCVHVPGIHNGTFVYNNQGQLFLDCVYGSFSYCPGRPDFIRWLRDLDERGEKDLVFSLRTSQTAPAMYGTKIFVEELVHKFLHLIKNEIPVMIKPEPEEVFDPQAGRKYFIGFDPAVDGSDYTITMPSGMVVKARVPTIAELEAMDDSVVEAWMKKNFQKYENMSMDDKRELMKYTRDMDVMSGNNSLGRPLSITFKQ